MTHSNKKILVVEDEFVIRSNIVLILESIFYKKNIYKAQNGVEGLEQIIKNDPDIILTDIKMPLMNGFEMTKKIRESGNDIPIIVISAFEEEIYKMVRLYDIKEYIIKPVIESDLKLKIKRSL